VITFYACTYHSASQASNNGGFYIRKQDTNVPVFLKFDSDTGIPVDQVINDANPDFEQQVGGLDHSCSRWGGRYTTRSCRQASTSLEPGAYSVTPATTTVVEYPCPAIPFATSFSFIVSGSDSSVNDTTAPELLVCPQSPVVASAGCLLPDVSHLPVFSDCSAITLTQSPPAGPLPAGSTTVTVSAADASGNIALPCIMPVTGCVAPPTPRPTSKPTSRPTSAPSLRSIGGAPSFESKSHAVCENFAVHAQTTVTFAGVTSTINGGDVGVSPGTSITGAFTFADGGAVVEDSAEFAARVLAAHAEAMAVRSDDVALAIEIGGLTFTPGTYRSDSAINFAHGTVVTLDGENESNPVFLFQAGSTLVTAADTSFILINGAKAENVLWALGTAATLGANSVLEGSILAGTAITFGTQSELHGCALALSAVTFESEGYVVI
jgi:hypothetical protein